MLENLRWIRIALVQFSKAPLPSWQHSPRRPETKIDPIHSCVDRHTSQDANPDMENKKNFSISHKIHTHPQRVSNWSLKKTSRPFPFHLLKTPHQNHPVWFLPKEQDNLRWHSLLSLLRFLLPMTVTMKIPVHAYALRKPWLTPIPWFMFPLCTLFSASWSVCHVRFRYCWCGIVDSSCYSSETRAATGTV